MSLTGRLSHQQQLPDHNCQIRPYDRICDEVCWMIHLFTTVVSVVRPCKTRTNAERVGISGRYTGRNPLDSKHHRTGRDKQRDALAFQLRAYRI
jgi:hypothetical protein